MTSHLSREEQHARMVEVADALRLWIEAQPIVKDPATGDPTIAPVYAAHVLLCELIREWLLSALGTAGEPAPPATMEVFRDASAVRSAAQFVKTIARTFRHTEAVADCPHCNLTFLADRALEALGPEPVRAAPPGPPDPPRRPALAASPGPVQTPQKESST
jgi:hypothetical protein